MRYKKCWSEKDINLYFTTESREKNREAFERTHLPIDKIFVEFSQILPEEKRFITEEEFKEFVLASSPSDYNRIFLVVGETGSGKSELCQWLEYNINDGVHIPIHISRSDTKMEDIAGILNAHLPEESREPTERMELVGIPADYIADLLIAKLKIELVKDKTIEKQEDRDILEKLFAERVFKGKLASDVADYQQTVSSIGKERRLLILPKKSFQFFPIVGYLSNPDEAYRFVNRVITNTLKEYLKVSDVSQKLRAISERYLGLGKRPVLLLEDLTSFTFLAEDLIDYLFDLSKGHFDVVIGWTTGFEMVHRDYIFKAPDALTYMKERLKTRLILTDQNRSTFFLEEGYEALARKYLSAIKCGTCEICQRDKDGLYPFNSASLEKIYKNLQEGGNPKQTPRIFLEFVLRRVLQASEPPWKTFSNIAHLKSVPSLIGQAFAGVPDFVELVRWYGNEKEESIEIDSSVVDWFQVKSPMIPCVDGVYSIPKSRIAKLWTKVKETKIEGFPKISPGDLLDFEQWITTGTLFLGRESLRKGVIKAVQMIWDPCEIRNLNSTIARTVSVFYSRGSDPIPVFIEDSGDDPLYSDFKLHVSRHSQPEVLEQLMYLGLGGYSISDEVLIPLMEWAHNRALEYNLVLKENLTRDLGMPVEHFIIFAKFLLLNLLKGCLDLNVDEFKIDIVEEKASVPSFPDEYINEKLQTLLNDRINVQGLFSSFFLLTNTFFDYPLFKQMCSEISLPKTLTAVSKIDLRKLSEAYKIGTKRDNKPFRDLVRAVRDYAAAIRSYSYTNDFDHMKEELTTISGLIPTKGGTDEIKDRIERLKEACGTLGIPLEHSWLRIFELVSSEDVNLNKLLNEIESVLSHFSECKDVFHFIAFSRKFQDIQSKIEYSVISVLGQIALAIQTRANFLIKSLEEGIVSTPDIERVRKAYEQLSIFVSEFTQ